MKVILNLYKNQYKFLLKSYENHIQTLNQFYIKFKPKILLNKY